MPFLILLVAPAGVAHEMQPAVTDSPRAYPGLGVHVQADTYAPMGAVVHDEEPPDFYCSPMTFQERNGARRNGTDSGEFWLRAEVGTQGCGRLRLELPCLTHAFGMTVSFVYGVVVDLGDSAEMQTQVVFQNAGVEIGRVTKTPDADEVEAMTEQSRTHAWPQELMISDKYCLSPAYNTWVTWEFKDTTGRPTEYQAFVKDLQITFEGALNNGEYGYGSPCIDVPELGDGWDHQSFVCARRFFGLEPNTTAAFEWLQPEMTLFLPHNELLLRLSKDDEIIHDAVESEIPVASRSMVLEGHVAYDEVDRLEVYAVEDLSGYVSTDPPLEEVSDESDLPRVFRIGTLLTAIFLLIPLVATLPGMAVVVNRSLDRHGMRPARFRLATPLVAVLAAWGLALGWQGFAVYGAGGFIWPPTGIGAALLLILLVLIGAAVAVDVAAARVRRTYLGRAMDAAADAEQRASTMSERAKELETYVHGVTHDLKTPLIAIDWLTNELEQDIKGANPAVVEETLSRIRKSVGGMDSLVKSLLEIGRVDQLDEAARDVVDLAVTLDGVRDHLEVAAKQRQVAVLDRFKAPPRVLGDAGLLEQVLRNLVGNAIKYGVDQGVVDVSWRSLPDGSGELWVEDNGPGIPREEREKVFGMFQRASLATSSATEGTGVGLALVQRIVEKHGGSVRIEDSRLGGAAFVVRFPRERVVE